MATVSKKITELPIVSELSGSTAIPVVMGGNTNQITAQNFALDRLDHLDGLSNSIQAYTSSLKQAITINGTDVQVIGTLRANEFNVTLVSSSILLATGSNIFGDSAADVHDFIGTVRIDDRLKIPVYDTIGLDSLGDQVVGEIVVNSDDNSIYRWNGSNWINTTDWSSITAIPTFATTGSNTFIGNQTITGSLFITGSATINDILVLEPRTTEPVTPLSGSIIVSGSGLTIKPYFWDGNVWNPLY